MKLIKKNNNFYVSNGYWQTEHDPSQGGCITSIKIFNGTNKNILAAPIRSYISKYSETEWTYPDFRDDLDTNASIRIIKNNEIIKIKTRSRLTDTAREQLPAELITVYEYHFAYIKIFRTFKCKEKIADINQVGAGTIETIPELNCWTARHSAAEENNESAENFEHIVNIPSPKWGKIDNTISPAFISWHPALHLCIFNNGIEGIETFPDSNIKEWEEQIVSANNGRCARFAVNKRFNPDRSVFFCEPYFGIWEKPVTLHGEYSFVSYIGLPNIRKNGPDKKFIWINTVLRIRKENRWTGESEIKEMSDNGIQLLIHHHDTPKGHGLWPDGSFFWPDGKFPPYEKTELLNMKKTIKLAHKYRMKIIPYFNPRVLHAAAKEYKKNINNWSRIFGADKNPHYYYDESGGSYGAMACIESGFSDFLKTYIKKIIKTYNFDGAYFDGPTPAWCGNTKHAEHPHTSTDGMIDLIEYTRKLVGDNGIIVAHQTMSPLIAIENLVNISVIMENVNGFPIFYKGVPELDCFTMHCSFVNVTHKAVCGYTAIPGKCPENEIKKLVARCIVKGLSFKGKSYDPFKDYEYWKHLSRYLKKLDLSGYRFEDHSKKMIVSSNPAVCGALFHSADSIVAILANTESAKKENFIWNIDLKRCIYKKENMTVYPKDRDAFCYKEDGIEDTIGGFEVKIYDIR